MILRDNKMRKYPLLMFVLFSWIVGTMAARQKDAPVFTCSDAIGCVTIDPGEPIELGVLQALSGGPAPIGLAQVRSIELAVAARDGQLLGHPIELQIEDEYCSPEGGTVAAQKLASDPQIIAILGTTCSGAAAPAAQVMSAAGLVMISGENTAPSLTAIGGKPGPDWQPGYFRSTYNDTVRGQAAATFVFRELGLTQVATINDGDAFTQGLTDAFEQKFTGLGGEIVLAATVNKEESNMHPVLEAVALAEAQLVARQLPQKYIEEYGTINCANIQLQLYGRVFYLEDPEEMQKLEEAGAHSNPEKCPRIVGNAAMWTMEILLDKGAVVLG